MATTRRPRCRSATPPRTARLAALPALAAGTSAVVAVPSQPGMFVAVAGLAAVVVLTVIVGVVLPAVWSRKPARRGTARALVDRLLGGRG